MSSNDTAAPHLCEYAARVIAQRVSRMLAHSAGAEAGHEMRPIHQMRVWSRRTRAAHELFAVCFSSKEYSALGREVKAVTDALSEARDLDVMIETLEKRRDTLPEEQRAGLEAFISSLRDRRKVRQRAVRRAVRRLEKQEVRERFAHLLGKYGAVIEPATQEPGVKEEAANG